MSRHPLIFIVHSINLWGMMTRIVGLMNSCMKVQRIHIEFKDNYIKNGMLHSSTLQEEETAILVVDSEEEDEEEAWVEVRGPIICYNYTQPGHLARDCQNPCTTCNYYNSFDHVI
jgi:hypothetical protein